MKKKGRPHGTKVGRRNTQKIAFRAEWDSLFSLLTDSEKKIYPTIIRTTASICGMVVPTTNQIYLVRFNRNNKNLAVLFALRVYVETRAI